MTNERATCVILVSRQPVLLRTLKKILEPEIEVINMVDNAISLIDALGAQEPDALILEMSLSDRGDKGFVRRLARRYPHLPIIVLGDDDDPAAVDEAIASGAAAYVTKQQAATDLRTAVCEAVRGDSPQIKGSP